MSVDKVYLKERVNELWDSATRKNKEFFEKAQQDFCLSIESELSNLKPSQYEEFINIARQIGDYIPSEELTPWQDYYSNDELRDMGLDV